MFGLKTQMGALSMFAALAGGCPGKDDGETDAATDSSQGTDATTHATSGTDSTTTEPTTTTTTEPTTTTTTGGGDSSCEAYVAWLVMCDELVGPEAEELTACKEDRESYEAVFGPACSAKNDDYYACVVTAECTEEPLCPAEEAVVGDCSPEIGETCMAYGTLLASCNPGDDPAEIMSQCQLDLNINNYFDPACGAAFEALYKCVGGKTCQELEEGTACGAEATAVDSTCMGE